MNKLAKNNAGFTLLEVVVALTILSLSMGIIYAILGSSMKRLANEETRNKALSVAVRIMEEVGSSRPLADGKWQDSVADGLKWSLTIEQEKAEQEDNQQPKLTRKVKLFKVEVLVGEESLQNPLVKLNTFKVAPIGGLK